MYQPVSQKQQMSGNGRTLLLSGFLMVVAILMLTWGSGDKAAVANDEWAPSTATVTSVSGTTGFCAYQVTYPVPGAVLRGGLRQDSDSGCLQPGATIDVLYKKDTPGKVKPVQPRRP